MSDNGLDRMNRRFDAVLKNVREQLPPALIKQGERLAALQSQLAPEFSGALKESIAVTPPGKTTPPYSQPGGSRTAGPYEVIVTAGDSYARYVHLVEFGTANAPAQPYFWPAYRLLRPAILRDNKRIAGKLVRDGWNSV